MRGLIVLGLFLTGFPACSEQVAEPKMVMGVRCNQDFVLLTGRVVDEADLLTSDQEQRIEVTLASLEENTRHQFVVATVTTLQGKSIDDYSNCLANHWGIGRKGLNDGIVLVVAPIEGKVRIQTGLGLERALTDNEALKIMDDKIIPAFKSGKMAKGIEIGVAEIIMEIS